MHGNHQNWKGNKGVPEGAPLSLHGGCLATPASRPPPAPSLLTPSALTPSQPFPPLTTAAPLVALSRIHFTFFSPLLPPPSFAYPYSGIPMLSFSPVAQSPDLASLELPLTPALPPSLTPPRFIRLFSPSLSFPFGGVCTSEGAPGFYSPLGNCVSPPSPLPHLQLARVYPLPRASVAHFPHLFSPFLHLIPPPSRFLASQKPSLSLPSFLPLSIYLSPSLLSYRETR